MGHEHQAGPSVAAAAEDLAQPLDALGVERVRALIYKDEPRLMEQSAPEQQAGAVARGERVRRPVELALEPELSREGADPEAQLLPAEAVEGSEEAQVLARR